MPTAIDGKMQNQVPPFSVFWGAFCQATDPATDPANMVGPGKLWIETDDDLAPTVIVGYHIWKPDDTGWLDFPVGSLSSGGDADTLDGIDSVAFALLASPAFSGVPTSPTAAPGTNTTQLANTAFVAAALAALIGTAPGVLDTLGEISDAINDDANLYTTLVAAIAAKISNSLVDAKGDLLAASADNTPARLAVGSNGQVLTADSGEATGLKWTTPSAVSATLTTKGDVLTRDASAEARLGVGSNGQVLTADSAQSLGVKWATPAAASAGSVTATKTGTYTAAANDFVPCDASGGAFSVTLPAAVANTIIQIKKIDSSANVVTVDGDGSETIDGALTYVLTTQYESVSLIAISGAWYVM